MGKDGYAPLENTPQVPPNGQSAGPGYTALALGTALGQQREWRHECWQVCGDCDSVGWSICCLTTFCNPCMFWFVVHKAFGSLSKAVKWGILYTILFATYFGIYEYLTHTKIKDDNEGFSYRTEVQQDGISFNKYLTLYCIMLVAALGFLVLGIVNRMAMRRRFDIAHRVPGAAGWDDCCMWFWCNSCALCQEARTIVYNNVEDGVWRGPDVMAVEPAVGTAVMSEAALPHAPPQREATAAKPGEDAAAVADRLPLLPYVPPQKAAQASPGSVDPA